MTSTNELHAYFSTINGVVDGGPYGHLIFFHHLYEPRSTADAIDHYEFLGEMRAGPHLETQRESDEWWPKGMVRFGGFDSDGLYVNCIDGSPTFGAVYEVHANTSPFMRIANSMRAYFETHTAAIETGAIELIETPGEHEDKGELVTIYPKLRSIGATDEPGLPKIPAGRRAVLEAGLALTPLQLSVDHNLR